MRTLLSHFCEQFEGLARPLLDPLGLACDALAAAPFDLPARRVLPGLRDVRHQFEALVEKVSGQQSYVLIFGPLKSGKSTLMNAVAASYVSEVTCLPAYPCMVYVGHREERELRVTHYDGTSAHFTDPGALRRALAQAHAELAEKIRSRGDGEETFDPAVHFPEAIRRVDVGLPAGQLARSGAVMVDTPGLYARMRFGYDRMTREFRHSAACAVFVVKTDNLFLEQVFEEFGRLLDLFSRVFLVVNLDSTKQDLRPDGQLVASLESEDPGRVVEAFEKLSMDAPLRAAVLDGKLRIYPVDLLRAASVRLRQAGGGSAPGEADVKSIADFDRFLGDLTTYLNSNDYLRAFLGDSLRRADALLRETNLLCDMGPVRELATRVRSLREEEAAAQDRLARVVRVASIDWGAALADLRPRLAEAVRGRGREIRDKTSDAIGGLLDRWFAGEKGLGALLEEEAGSLFASSLREAAPVVVEALRGIAASSGGARLSNAVRDAIAAEGVPLADAARRALEAAKPLEAATAAAPEIDVESIPVRRGFLDYLLFRTARRVRRRLWGPEGAPFDAIPASVKARRLGAAGREALRRSLQKSLDAFFPQALGRMVEQVAAAYPPSLADALRGPLDAKRAEAQDLLDRVAARLAETGRVGEALAALSKGMESGIAAVADLTKRHGETDPALLLQPMESATEAEDGGEAGSGQVGAA